MCQWNQSVRLALLDRLCSSAESQSLNSYTTAEQNFIEEAGQTITLIGDRLTGAQVSCVMPVNAMFILTAND